MMRACAHMHTHTRMQVHTHTRASAHAHTQTDALKYTFPSVKNTVFDKYSSQQVAYVTKVFVISTYKKLDANLTYSAST